MILKIIWKLLGMILLIILISRLNFRHSDTVTKTQSISKSFAQPILTAHFTQAEDWSDAYFSVTWFANIDDRNPNINMREIIWLGDWLVGALQRCRGKLRLCCSAPPVLADVDGGSCVDGGSPSCAGEWRSHQWVDSTLVEVFLHVDGVWSHQL